MSLLLGYNTNGFAHHRLEDALDILAEEGYESVGLTLDVHHAPPGKTDYQQLAKELADRNLLPVVETGARFLLDPRSKHQPTMLSEGRERRIAFYKECVDIAATLGAPCISLWSGLCTQGDDWGCLIDGLTTVCDHAAAAGIDVGFEPEPDMFIDTMARFDQLREALPHEALKLTLDVGHVHCLEDEPPERIIERYGSQLVNVHLDDHKRGVHNHLMFGEGEIKWKPVMRALVAAAADRDIPATVELSRHSHDAPGACMHARGSVARKLR
ncbi:MAG: sugar phosphate isomerase/epimerase family protein [Planctomycetota bacterium]